MALHADGNANLEETQLSRVISVAIRLDRAFLHRTFNVFFA
jgi:hypothetical protein